MISHISLENFQLYFLISILHIIYFWWWPSLLISSRVSFFMFSRGTSSWDCDIFSSPGVFGSTTFEIIGPLTLILSRMMYWAAMYVAGPRIRTKEKFIHKIWKTVLSRLPQSPFSSLIFYCYVSHTTTPVLSSVFIRTMGKYEGFAKVFSEACRIGSVLLLPSSQRAFSRLANRVTISLGFSSSTGPEGSLLYSLS